MDNEFSLKLKIQDIGFETPAIICILNEKDARNFGVVPDDRIILKNMDSGQYISAVVDVSKKTVKQGFIGISETVKEELNLINNNYLYISHAAKPKSFDYIKKKIANEPLTNDEMKELVHDIQHNALSTIELTAFITAVKINGYNVDETYSMAKYIADSGDKLKLNVDGIIVDKHSIGGINGRATMIVVPIIANFDQLYMPKTSSRAITSPAGTADAMEVLTNVSLDINQLSQVVEKTHGALVWGGGFNFAPVDDKIIKIERPLRIDPQGQVIASVLSKKRAVGAQKVVIDVPVGADMKVKTLPEAEDVATRFVNVGKKLDMDIRGVITNANTPCGAAFGSALEAKYAMEILEGKFYDNLAEKSCELAGQVLELSGVASKGEGTTKAKEILKSGKALTKMKQIIDAQGKKINNSKDVPIGEYYYDVLAKDRGTILSQGVFNFTTIALSAGAPFDKGAGVLLKKKINDQVEKDDVLYRIYANNKDKLEYAKKMAEKLEPIKLEDIIIKEIS